MASVKVAARVRPLNARERSLDSEVIIEIVGKTITVTNAKVPDHTLGDQNREKTKIFTFDHSYWSVSPSDAHYVSQEQVFDDLGLDIIQCAYDGYNACVFAYGQTGSGKTYTMTGNPGEVGLIPRISNGLFERMTDESKTYRAEVSYFEIYNEAVRDLLPSNANKGNQSLRVREHPKDGPYVEDLSHHLVTSYDDIKELIDQGNNRRTTAATNMNDVSSRSHAIFTIAFTQAKFSKNSPSETYSKIRLVDLAGSERADATGNTGLRLKEGGSINKSLVTLGNVISTLADMCDKGTAKKCAYIPYRDSVLTWLLKDSLGGNSKTIMIATVSPAGCNYTETVSTLRYANRAKNIINKPKVNEDPNVKLIRELRAEIARLKALLGGNIDEFATPKLQELLTENEARVKVLTEQWTGRWKETAAILKEGAALALRRDGLGVVLDSDLPHLIGIDDDLLSTGMILYHLKEGPTTIGTESAEEKQNIALQGSDVQPEHCVIYNESDEVSLVPMANAECYVNGVIVNSPVTLSQGDVIILGRTNMFRFNHPLQATKLRKELKESNTSLSRMSLLSQSRLEIFRSTDNLNWSGTGGDVEQQHKEQLEALERKRREVEEMKEKLHLAESDRQARQVAEELELERRRQILEKMQAEAEKMKREAEMVQKQVKEEVSELKQKSMNFEKQLQRYWQLGGGNKLGLEPRCITESETSGIADDRAGHVDDSGLIPLQKKDLESELRKLDDSIQLLKKLQIDYNFFDSIAADLDDSVQSKIQIEIEHMDRLLSKIADLNSKTSINHSEKKTEILERTSMTLAELETQLSATSEEEAGILKEMSLLQGSDEGFGSRELMAELENQKMNVTNGKIELIAARDNAEALLFRELEELERQNEDLLKELEAAADEVTEHEVIYQRLVSEVLKENEIKREKMMEMMEETPTARVGWTVTEAEEDGETVGEVDMVVLSSTVVDGLHADETKMQLMDNEEHTQMNKVNKEDQSRSVSEASEADHIEILLSRENCRMIRSGHTMLTNGANEGQEVEDEKSTSPATKELDNKHLERTDEQLQVGVSYRDHQRSSSKAEQVCQLEKLDVSNHPLEIQITEVEGGSSHEMSNSDQNLERRETGAQIKKCEESGTRSTESAEMTQSMTDSDSTHEALSNASSLLENFPVASRLSPLVVFQSSSSSNPFHVRIPCSVFRGSGLSTYVEFEVKVAVLEEEWTIFRRYRRFHQLHSDLLSLYSQVASLEFPPKKLFTTEKVIAVRRTQLENYLQKLLEVLYNTSGCPLHPSHANIYCKQLLSNFHPFFQKGIFETTKHSAC